MILVILTQWLLLPILIQYTGDGQHEEGGEQHTRHGPFQGAEFYLTKRIIIQSEKQPVWTGH